MTMMVDPKKDSSDGFSYCTPGRKVLGCAGVHMSRSQNGNPQALVLWVCLKDLEENGEEGATNLDNLTLTDKAKWRVANAVDAAGYDQPFDAHDKAQLQKALGNFPIVATLKNETYEGKTRAKIDKYETFTGTPEDSWEGLMEQGAKALEAIVAKRATQDSGEGQSSGDGGRWGKGGGGGQSTESPPSDDDIPFAWLFGMMGAGGLWSILNGLSMISNVV